MLRRTCATSALKGGADVVAVQKMLGDRQLATTVEAYLHDTGDSMERATQALVKARYGITAFGTKSDTGAQNPPQRGGTAITPKLR